MGSIPLDNGESVYTHDGTGDADPIAISAAEGSNLAALMRNRERFDYTWANSTERGAQTGMVQGSRGYQEDTKTEYLYDSSAWRLATPYAEFSGSNISMGAGIYEAGNAWTVDATRSTDTTFVTVSGNAFNFVRPGVYMMSATAELSAVGSNAFQDWTTDGIAPPTQFIAINGFFGGVSTVQSLYRISAANTPIYLWAYNNISGTLSGRRTRIVRLG